MNSAHTTIDISNKPELLRLAEEVKTSGKLRVLKNHRETVAVLMPAEAAGKQKQEKARTSVKEALALAGAWADLPSENMEEELDRIRHESKPTPPLKL